MHRQGIVGLADRLRLDRGLGPLPGVRQEAVGVKAFGAGNVVAEAQDADDVRSSPQRQLLEHPEFGRVAKPQLHNHREIQAFTAVAENPHVPDVFVLLGLRSDTSGYRFLQLLSEPTDMACRRATSKSAMVTTPAPRRWGVKMRSW
jgi:hypothetical protein